jgi:superfamily I DNA/RNA helicase
MGVAPELAGDALAAVEHRGSHVQIIAAAGSGKTEVVSQRVVALLAEGVPAEAIVAFTFTERAAEELKQRIALRVEERLGVQSLDRLNGLFVGTIHAYCFRLLQQHVPRFETYDVLDDNRLTAFLAREAKQLELRQLDPKNRLFASIAAFLQNVDVIENELLDPSPARADQIDRRLLLCRPRPVPAADIRAAGWPHRAGAGVRPATGGPPPVVAASHRGRVPGRQSRPGTTHRTLGWTGDRALRRRR